MEKIYDSLLDEAVATGLNVVLIGEAGAGKEWTARLLHARRKTFEFCKYDFQNGETVLWSLIAKLINELDLWRAGCGKSKVTYFLRNIHGLDRKQVLYLLDYLHSQLDNARSSSFAILHSGLICSCEPQIAGSPPYRDLITQFFPIEIIIPPLRERLGEIPLLTYEILAEYRRTAKQSIVGIGEDTKTVLENYHWPGNISELKSVLGQACALTKGNEIISRHVIEKRMSCISIGSPQNMKICPSLIGCS